MKIIANTILAIMTLIVILAFSQMIPTAKICQFKVNGERVCSSKATVGDLCYYHFKMLDDTYNDLVG